MNWCLLRVRICPHSQLALILISIFVMVVCVNILSVTIQKNATVISSQYCVSHKVEAAQKAFTIGFMSSARFVSARSEIISHSTRMRNIIFC